MKREQVKWEAPEPFAEDPGPPVQIVRLPPKVSVRGLVLSDQVIGVKTHWIFGRTKPCVGPENGCEGCRSSTPFRKKGYLAVYLIGSKRVALLEITQHAFDHNLQLCAAQGLRGMDFIATRTGTYNNAPVVIDLQPSLTKPEAVPPCIDVHEVLMRIWFGREKNHKPKKERGQDNGTI